MKRPSLAALEVGAILLAVAGAGYLIWKASNMGAAVLSGDNALTRNAKNAAGQSVTGYREAGVLGTLGAAANAASGGYLASIGEWIGGALPAMFVDKPAAAPAPAASAYQTGGQTRERWADEIDATADLGYAWQGFPQP